MVSELEAELEQQADEIEHLQKTFGELQHLASFDKIHALAQSIAQEMLNSGTVNEVARPFYPDGLSASLPEPPPEQA
jgi:hypothetical protein